MTIVGTQTFLALDEPFLPAPTRAEPRLFVGHVRFLASAGEVLREVRLRPGLNVVWAPDSEPEDRVGSRMGHGAGKTLFCRLMRHVLGEPDVASPDDAGALARRFPEGAVEAEVTVDGARWAVRRPFDPSLDSSAQRDGVELGYDAFVSALRALVPAPDARDAWLAALAWMSRDQERRFGGPLRWRDRAACPRSKLARVANLERIRAMRSLLGLRDEVDVAAESEVALLEQRERTTIEQLADHERAIAWLGQRLAREGIGEASELLEPLSLHARVRDLEAELAALDGADEAVVAEERTKVEEAVRAHAAASLLLEQLRGLTPGDPCGACHGEAARGPSAKALRTHERALRRAEKALEAARASLTRSWHAAHRADREAWASARERYHLARDLARHLHRRTELATELDELRLRLVEARAARDAAMARHARQQRRVADVFDFVVRRLAGQDVRGKLTLTTTQLEASIRLADGRAGTSPALRVLETLALDLSALVLACEDRASLPGLWIHDSPREADLARSHYDALYRLAAWLETATNAPGFQYIITTTTRPPAAAALRSIRLGAATPDELLLGAVL